MTDILVITGLVGRGPVAGGRRPRGPRLVRRRQPARPRSSRRWPSSAAAGARRIEHLALVVGSGAHQADITEVVARLRADGHRVRILFLEASTPELVRRYGSTRRKHPLADGSQSVMDLIEDERELLEPVQGQGRPGHRHHRAQRPPAQGPARRRVRRGRAGGRHADHGHVVRLQARPPPRRRPRARLPVPAQPVLGRGPAAPHRPRARGASSTCSATR